MFRSPVSPSPSLAPPHPLPPPDHPAMSQVKLTLRPPPNVDFVHGYPGIPPGGDRVQAAVKGAIEVRVPPAGVKAKWVRIELRKVETLPGGGQANTFYDFVGPSPVNLWTSPNDYSILRTQDFAFSIRIPESIPPSIALENRAGIQYELVASVCTKGKRSFLRSRKTVVISESSPVIIDKHELHSTWPVYCQPETRQLAQDGVTLIIERNHTCYGPGDRVSLVATLKSDNLHTVILRGFEMTLRESTIFRASAFGTTRKAAPQTKVINIAETKVAINATLYGGTMHKAELTCQLPHNHTTTTLNAARHIDVTYVLSVKALMGTGTHITMDLPVIVSNWQRYVSQEAIRRIGPAPSLSLLPPASITTPVMSIQPSSNSRTQQQPVTTTTPPQSQFNSLPVSTAAARSNMTGTTINAADELGYGAGYGKANTHRQNSAKEEAPLPPRPGTGTTPSTSSRNVTATERRPNSARPANTTNRFTIANAEPDGSEDHTSERNVAAPSPVRPQQQPKQWATAEEEKRAYEQARSKVEKINGVVPTTTSPSQNKTATTGTDKPWLTAEEEKAALYEKARAAVVKTQRHGTGAGDSSGRTPAELYQSAMSKVNSNPNKSQPETPHVSPLSGGSSSRKAQPGSAKIPQYLTAEQEKAALRRYEEAMDAVNRVHASGFPDTGSPGPIAYDSLYPKAGGSGSASADPPPPSFEASVSAAAASMPMSALAEKERLRRAYEEQDALAGQQPNDAPPSFNAATTQAGAGPTTAQQYMDAAAEKEALRLKLELKDAQAAARKKSATSLGDNSSRQARPTPAPPVNPSAKILTAADEKALLKAKYEAKDAKARGRQNGHVPTTPPATVGAPASASQTTSASSPPPPPPLMPRPPADYIQETQEEDARVSKFAIDGQSIRLEEGEEDETGTFLNKNGTLVKTPGPPPPLPPKPAGQ